MKSRLPLLVCALALAVGTPAAAGAHKDPRLGFSLDVPRGWEAVPVSSDESWIVAKFLSDKADHWTDPTFGYTWEHRSSVNVIAFLDDMIAKQYEAAEERGDEDPNIIDDYKEYMRAAFADGGFYFSEEERIEYRGMNVDCYEIKVEKGTRTGPKRLVAWVFQTELGAIAVQMDSLEDSFKKNKRSILKTLKSFKRIERTESLDLEAPKSRWVSLFEMDQMTQEERNANRQAAEEKLHVEVTGALPDDWEAEVIDGVLVLNHADSRYAKRAVERINAITDWLEDTFPDIGKGEYTRRPILRVCKDYDEERAFRKGSGSTDWGGMGFEIVIHKDADFGSTSSEWDWVNRRTMDIWFRDRNRELYWTMPGWLRNGMKEFVESADVKGSKMRFKPGMWEKRWLKDSVEDGAIPIQSLIRLTNADYGGAGGEAYRETWAQSAALVRYLMDGKGKSKRATKDLIPRYLNNLAIVIEELDKAQEAKLEVNGAPTNEAEEEALYASARATWVKREKELIERTIERTFAGWDDKDWRSFESDYLKSIK